MTTLQLNIPDHLAVISYAFTLCDSFSGTPFSHIVILEIIRLDCQGGGAYNRHMSKEDLLKSALADIEKQFGAGSIMRLGDAAEMKVDVISTGSLALDIALGVKGLPKGRVVEIYGPESSGKTTLALHAIAEAQKLGGKCAFIDAEHALDPIYASNIGCDIDNLLISQPDNGEQALTITNKLVESGALDIIVVDSVAALTPRAEIEGEMGDSHVGLHARLMSQAMRKIVANLNNSKTILIMINQLREKIGVMFGSPETTTGGKALKFYASVRMDVRRIETLKTGDEASGNKIRVKIVKNKVAPPHRQAEFEIAYGSGISRTGDIVDIGASMGILEKKGAWYAYNGENIAQGRVNTKKYLDDNTEIREEIAEKIYGMI
jgi:recombination protein RecA